MNNRGYGDDTLMIADTEEKLQRLVDRFDVECWGIGLRINTGKAEVMGVTTRREQVRVNVNIGGQAVKRVKSFRYLISLVDEDSRYDAKITSRIRIGNERDAEKYKIKHWGPVGNFEELHMGSDYVWV